VLSTMRFCALAPKNQHKILAELLSYAHKKNLGLEQYNKYAQEIDLAPLDVDNHSMCDRFHWHCQRASISFDEAHWPRQTDSLSHEPFLPIDIYCSKLRSAHNVGSIIRTTEAFRLGSIHACKDTPLVDHQKVKKTSMQTSHLVTLNQATALKDLRQPFIALETTDRAQDLFTFKFPKSFTLFVGNEQAGLSGDILDQCEYHIKIPLVGSKNSLNVANAFAIAAAAIRSQSGDSKN
jgi:tRNA G18 (ribose-2'-O)-methylase SpoU